MGVCGIYEIKNHATGKIYIGSAISIENRWRRHVDSLVSGRHKNALLQASWNKHGKGAFSVSVLEVVAEKEDLLIREQYWLDAILPFPPLGYNLYRIAGSPLGHKHKEATKRKMSQRRKGQTQSQETREKIRLSLVGRKFSEEHRANISQAQKAMPPDVREKLTGMKGKKHSAETKLKMSLSRINYCKLNKEASI